MGFIKDTKKMYHQARDLWQQASDFISPEPTLDQSIQQVKNGICDIFYAIRRSAVAGRIYSAIRSGPLYDSLKKVDRFARDHKELIFVIMTIYALFQSIQSTFAAGCGFALGVAMGALGAKMGMAKDPIRLVTTRQGLATYNYLSVASMLLLAPWLSAAQQGLVAGNYLTSSMKKAAPLQMLRGLGNMMA